MEFKQHKQSVIASLMGLDEMPPRQPTSRQRRVLSENYLHKVASIGVREKRSKSERCSFRMGIEKQQVFKDIFEVPETVKKHRKLPIHNLKPKSCLDEVKTSFEREDFMEGKYFSLHDKLQYVEERDGEMELHSNDYLLQRTSEMTTMRRNTTKSHGKVSDGFLENAHRRLDHPHKSSKDYLHLKDQRSSCPIVVLKPNKGKLKSKKQFLVPCESYEGHAPSDRRQKVCCSGFEEVDIAVDERRKVDNDMEFSMHSFSVSRKLVKEIAQQIKHNSLGSTDILLSGWSGAETSARESDLIVPSSKTFYKRKKQFENLLSLNRESKKGESDQWNTTKALQEVGICSRFPGETLKLPDHETRSRSISSKLKKHSVKNHCLSSEKCRKFHSPLDTSSHDGWKDGCITDFPISRTTSATKATGGSNARLQREALQNDCSLRPEEAVKQNEVREQQFDHIAVSDRNPMCTLKNSSCATCMDQESKSTSKSLLSMKNLLGQELPGCNDPDNTFREEIPMITDYQRDTFEQNPSKPNLMLPKSSVDNVTCKGTVAGTLANAEIGDVELCPEFLKKQQSTSKHSVLSFGDGESFRDKPDSANPQESFGSLGKGIATSQCIMAETEHPQITNDAYQPSQVSVLDPLSHEEESFGHDCLESVSADLHGVQMHLQAKSQTEGAAMIMSSDEDPGKGSSGDQNRDGQLTGTCGAEGRDVSYLVDVLVEAGSHDGSWDLGFETWHSLGCPMSPLVFDVLEKNYADKCWERSERKLLFDCINSGLLDIYESFACTHKRKKPLTKWFGRSSWSLEAMQKDLWSFLVSEAKEASADLVLGKDMEWLEMDDEIRIIHRELEKILINELVEEFVSMSKSPQ